MSDKKQDICRIMAESLWCWAAVPTKYHVEDDEDKAKEEWLTEMTDAIRNHTTVPEMVELLRGAQSALYSSKIDKADCLWKIERLLTKAVRGNHE